MISFFGMQDAEIEPTLPVDTPMGGADKAQD